MGTGESDTNSDFEGTHETLPESKGVKRVRGCMGISIIHMGGEVGEVRHCTRHLVRAQTSLDPDCVLRREQERPPPTRRRATWVDSQGPCLDQLYVFDGIRSGLDWRPPGSRGVRNQVRRLRSEGCDLNFGEGLPHYLG